MTEKTFTDELLREVISKLALGEYERNATAYVDEGRQVDPHLENRNMFGLPTINASIIYKFESGLQIKAVPVTVKKLLDTENNQRVSLEDHLEFQKAENEEEKGVKKLESQYQVEHKEELAKWEEQTPAKKKKREVKGNRRRSHVTIDMHQLTRPTLKTIGRPLGGKKGHLGMLIASYDDTECLTARLKSAVVTYQPLEATMNYSVLKDITDMKKGDLTKIMDQLKERYQVETSYKYGEELKGPAIGNTCLAKGNPLHKEYQNNIFSLPLTPEMSVDDMVSAITRVYQAGEAFMQGYEKLKGDRETRIEHEKRLEERRQKLILEVF